MEIRVANVNDVQAVKTFLSKSEVSSDGIETIIDNFLIVENADKEMVATLGIERIENEGLLRSLVVTPEIDQTQILMLFKSAMSLAKHKELEHIYLATNKSATISLFSMLGFERVDKDELSPHLLTSSHMQQLVESEHTFIMKSKVG